MIEKGIHIEESPGLSNPILIAGFDGWGNALNISQGMVTYLIRKLKTTKYFARINADHFYRYDEKRPIVNIEDGELKGLSMPGGSLYFVRIDSGDRDLVILKADEPHLRWMFYVDELLSLCEQLSIDTIITLGSLYDSVLHSDRIISGYTSTPELFTRLAQQNVSPSSYQGPSSIQSLIHSEAKNRGFQCITLWCHCPYYLQGTTHFGILSGLGSLLSNLGGFALDIEELDASWNELNDQIQQLVDSNPKVRTIIEDIRQAKKEGSWANVKESIQRGEKVIRIEDLLKPE
jgi:proteasome assembly chaperone (PAC2) family protein